MKKYALMMVVLVMGLSLAAGAFAADKDAIKMQVDEIVVAVRDIDWSSWRAELESHGVGTTGVVHLRGYGIDLEEQRIGPA